MYRATRRRYGPAKLRKICLLAALLRIDRPRTRAGGGQVQESEAKQDGRIAAIQYGKWTAMRHVVDPVSSSGFSRSNKRRDPAEKPQHDQNAADEFDDTSRKH